MSAETHSPKHTQKQTPHTAHAHKYTEQIEFCSTDTKKPESKYSLKIYTLASVLFQELFNIQNEQDPLILSLILFLLNEKLAQKSSAILSQVCVEKQSLSLGPQLSMPVPELCCLPGSQISIQVCLAK